ncbi:MAG: hypothetical protein K8S15_09385 [Candidatus Aegiribacteria sp.]|nr:hypothetical protein [Candidatus Aegiribacteria sp.]
MLFSALLLFCSLVTASVNDQQDFWLLASGYGIMGDSVTSTYTSEIFLLQQLKNGNRKALIPLVRLFVSSGRIDDAEIWMEGRGEVLPVTRRDLGIALSWYGRFDLYNVISIDISIPPDIEDDDYAPTIAAILYKGWMNTSPDGCFHPNLLVGSSELELVSHEFFPVSFHWERDWIGIKSLDSLFVAGARERNR